VGAVQLPFEISLRGLARRISFSRLTLEKGKKKGRERRFLRGKKGQSTKNHKKNKKGVWGPKGKPPLFEKQRKIFWSGNLPEDKGGRIRRRPKDEHSSLECWG